MTPGLVNGHVTVEIELESDKIAKNLFLALNPETKSVPSERAVTQLTVKGNMLIIDVEAEDLTALRAAINSFLAWLSGCQKVIKAMI
ncbi:MAG: KEOPS complex subunit Pcc1 [Candidatus Thorarchaeota archaeon]|jgi:tRNA threonylcarbamoyladenosine modification (KEOPS) complex  Pcc1 subunit